MNTSVTTPREKQEILAWLGLAELDISGERGRILNRLLKHTTGVESGRDCADVAKHLGLPPQWSTRPGILKLIGAVVAESAALIDALETQDKALGVKAVAYTTTAWAFNESPLPPTAPDTVLKNGGDTGRRRKRAVQLWKDTATRALRDLRAVRTLNEKPISTVGLRLLLRSTVEGDKSKLARLVWDALRERLASADDKRALKGSAKQIHYPD